ncbi:hypothetical protein VTJ04DRAFT_1317 [Mycothermus thermophilus]|uniref:uncharacterized protein n=1 Tax=Humicola insolens TaxID=85995 RepID=UPI00374220AB
MPTTWRASLCMKRHIVKLSALVAPSMKTNGSSEEATIQSQAVYLCVSVRSFTPRRCATHSFAPRSLSPSRLTASFLSSKPKINSSFGTVSRRWLTIDHLANSHLVLTSTTTATILDRQRARI